MDSGQNRTDSGSWKKQKAIEQYSQHSLIWRHCLDHGKENQAEEGSFTELNKQTGVSGH